MEKEIIIKYKMTQNFDALLERADTSNEIKLNKELINRNNNRIKLLPYVLQLVESLITIHNMRCTRTDATTTGKHGLFAISPINLEKKLNYVVNSDNDWSSKGDYFSTLIGVKKIEIWLNNDDHHISTPNLEYSMSSILSKHVYADSIEDEMEYAINKLAKYHHDSW